MPLIEDLHDAFIIPPNVVSKVASIDEASGEGYKDNREVINRLFPTKEEESNNG
jgi:hypothetical protein